MQTHSLSAMIICFYWNTSVYFMLGKLLLIFKSSGPVLPLRASLPCWPMSHTSSHKTLLSTKHTADVRLSMRLLRAGKVELALLCFYCRARFTGFKETFGSIGSSSSHLPSWGRCNLRRGCAGQGPQRYHQRLETRGFLVLLTANQEKSPLYRKKQLGFPRLA